MAGPRVRRTRRGTYRLKVSRDERDLLRSLPGQLREALETSDPSTERLFPPADPDDAEASSRYRDLVGDQLLEGRLGALDTMEATIDAPELDEEQITAWLTTLNDMRIVLGTQLDVSEEPEPLPRDHPDAPRMAVYGYLGWLVSEIVEALSEDLRD